MSFSLVAFCFFSPGAVVAREYGIPCVVGINRATALFKSGQCQVREVCTKGSIKQLVRDAGCYCLPYPVPSHETVENVQTPPDKLLVTPSLEVGLCVCVRTVALKYLLPGHQGLLPSTSLLLVNHQYHMTKAWQKTHCWRDQPAARKWRLKCPLFLYQALWFEGDGQTCTSDVVAFESWS